MRQKISEQETKINQLVEEVNIKEKAVKLKDNRVQYCLILLAI